MNKPLISVITVVYNARPTLEATIQSVLSQDNELVEYWIIDGGSTDGSIDLIRQYESQLAGWISEPDKGIYDAMNKGIDRAKGDWLYFLGGDDTLRPDIAKQIQPDLIGDYKVVFGDILFTNNYLFHSFLSRKTLFQNTLHHQGAFYHRSLFKNFRYDCSFKTHADYELNIRVYTQHLPTKYVPLVVATCMLGGESGGYKEQALKEINLIRARYIKSYWHNAFLTYLLRAYFWQKQFRFWLYGHQI